MSGDRTERAMLSPMRIPAFALALVTFAAGCAAPEQPAPELDCFAVGGGFEGEDIEAIEAECRADSRGTDCEADDYIGADTAKCLVNVDWSDEERDAAIGYSYGYRTVIWSVSQDDELCNFHVNATTGQSIGSVCAR